MSKKVLCKPKNVDMQFVGVLKESVAFIEQNQLFDVDLWNKFVDVFRIQNDGNGEWFTTWRSEYWGKMLRGACMTIAYTKNRQLYSILEQSVRDLLATQDENGRISGYAVAGEFDSWDLWGRKYVMLGLMYFMEISDDAELNAQIRDSLCRQADYIMEHVGPEKRDIRHCSRHWEGLNSCSILEPVVRLYELTGEECYLQFAEYIISTGFVLSDNLIELAYNNIPPHQYPVVKAYEMMSCFEGLLRYYYITGIEKYKIALLNFGRSIIENEISVIGCSGCTHELFDHTAVRQTQTDYDGVVQETCVTVTWMKFALQLLELSGDSVYADKIEQSFYNAYRGSFNTQQIPCKNEGFDVNAQPIPFDSYSPLTANMRGRQVGGFNLLHDNTFYGCCACIGAAGVGVIPQMAVMHNQEGIAIQYYEKGVIHTVTPCGTSVQITMDTAYPNDGKVNITLSLNQNEQFKLLIRVPSWCDKATITYKNKTETFSAGYAVLDEVWQSHDQIAVDFAMCVKQVLPPENAVNRERFAAYTYGPLVLAADKRIADPDGIYNVANDQNGFVHAKRVDCPEIPEANICFELPLVSGGTVRLIDYASAGKTWSEESRCAAWLQR